MSDARWNEYCHSRAGDFRAVGVAKSELAVQHVPRFVIGTVDMKRRGAASSPLVDLKRGT
jgi:hypothetical protein